ncbi:MAG: PspC domain-containing protein [Gammaproteobacteria bacterium]|nr:PspC domain-containing protein [Gammaproteobacteria bacterium]
MRRHSASRAVPGTISRVIRDDTGWILGVCAGIAWRIRIDPAIVRIATIVALIFHPAITVACYLILWVIFFRGD